MMRISIITFQVGSGIYFVPYYFLAVVAIFGHIACAVQWFTRDNLSEVSRNYLGHTILAVGILASVLIVAAFAGAFYDVNIPQAYWVTYQL
jgi:hypothetical protein